MNRSQSSKEPRETEVPGKEGIKEEVLEPETLVNPEAPETEEDKPSDLPLRGEPTDEEVADLPGKDEVVVEKNGSYVKETFPFTVCINLDMDLVLQEFIPAIIEELDNKIVDVRRAAIRKIFELRGTEVPSDQIFPFRGRLAKEEK